MNRIFITGDTHGNLDIDKLIQFNTRSDLTKDDYVIITGDVAVIWYSFNKYHLNCMSSKDQKIIDLYNSFKFTTLFIDGNHENHIGLNQLPVIDWNGGKVHKISDSIFHLMRGQVYFINDKKFFTMGGAKSSDIEYRKPDISWWKGEMPSKLDYEEAIKNLENNDFKVDYVITHNCSTDYAEKFVYGHPVADELTQFFKQLETDLQFEHWYFGHHHEDLNIDEKHTCLYQQILQIL